jgi:DHA2 family multidrug resistance protein-like MFS transporter
MDLTVLHLAVPKLSADLQPSSAQLLWIIDSYGFLVAGSLITMGTLGDRIGRRRLLCWAPERSPRPRWWRRSRAARAC